MGDVSIQSHLQGPFLILVLLLFPPHVVISITELLNATVIHESWNQILLNSYWCYFDLLP